MQTFLPYADFTASSIALDNRRLGKQRVETFQILRALTWPDYAWKNHPAVRMWRGFVPALVAYGLTNCAEWIRRGNADTVEASLLAFTAGRRPDSAELARAGHLPPWLGLEPLHLSHRSALVRKDPGFYRPVFGAVRDDLPYLWPADTFPRWPARRPPGWPDLEAALAALGYPAPRPGQAEAVRAIEDGCDVLGCFAPGAGATSTALLAGLARGGQALWITKHAGTGGTVPTGGLTPPPPVVREAARPAGAASIARPPSPVEELAMASEADAVPDFRFHRPADLVRPDIRADLEQHPPTTVLIDLGADGDHPDPGSGERPEPAAEALAELRSLHPSVPVLLVGPAADADERQRLAARYGLREPVAVGGGFDPARVLLGRSADSDESRRRDTLARLVAEATGPVLVLASDRQAARRLAAGLEQRGTRAAAALIGSRRDALEAAIGGWRRGSYRALVLAADAPVPREQLGRKPIRALHLATAPASRREWLALLDRYAIGPASGAVSVLAELSVQADGTAPDDLAPVRDGARCRRLALLDAVGEPAPVPCGRCDVCLGVAVTLLPSMADAAPAPERAPADVTGTRRAGGVGPDAAVLDSDPPETPRTRTALSGTGATGTTATGTAVTDTAVTDTVSVDR